MRGAWRKPRTIPKESNIEESCREYAHAKGWTSRKMNGFGFRSWPDRFFLPKPIKGMDKTLKRSLGSLTRRFWVEFKRPGETSTPDQRRMQKDLRKRGEVVYEIDNKQEFIRIFDRHNYS